VGMACYPEDGGDAEELLAIADARMYEIKRQHHALARLAYAVEHSETDGRVLSPVN
jgi:GGDEF domain-containing protein